MLSLILQFNFGLEEIFTSAPKSIAYFKIGQKKYKFNHLVVKYLMIHTVAEV